MVEDRIYLLFDLDRCWGCKACEIACKEEHELGVGPRPMFIEEIGPIRIDGKLHREFIPTMCQHCDEAHCIKACPQEAIGRAADGTVQIDKSLCTGCGICSKECPFGVVTVTDEGYAVKCSLCLERRKGGRIPSCTQHCLGRAITLIEESQLELYLRDRYHWRNGRIVYLSNKWASLGEALGV